MVAAAYKILVCRGPECGDKRDSRRLYETLQQALVDRGCADRVELGWQSCFGRCTQGPNCYVKEVLPGEKQRFAFAQLPSRRRTRTALYNRLSEANMIEIVDNHVLGGRILRHLIHRPKRSHGENK